MSLIPSAPFTAFTHGQGIPIPNPSHPCNPWLVFPSTHYVNFAQAILHRGAGIEIVWRSFAAITVIGLIFFAMALLRFRRTVAIT
jgi:ABC-type multidrug transport system permease subunit